MSDNKENITELLNTIIAKVPHPVVELEKDFSMLVSQTESNNFFGKMLIGRINSGKINVGDRIHAIDLSGKFIEANKVHKIIRRFGVHQLELQTAVAGDIVSIAGFEKGTVTNTLNTLNNMTVIPVSLILLPLVYSNRSPYDLYDN